MREVDKGLSILQQRSGKSGLDSTPALDILRKDYLGIISLIYSYTTRLWIALGKQPPTPSAAGPTLEELTKHTSSLYGCVLAFGATHGKAFSDEVEQGALGILQSMSALFREYSSAKNGGESMQMTASVHEACDKARNLSIDSREAVLKRWKVDSESLKDAIKEVYNLLDQDNEEDAEDGWDELVDADDMVDQSLSEQDRMVVKKVATVLEKLSAFRKHFQKTLLAGNSPLRLTPSTYDQYLEATQVEIPLIDEIVGCLDPPMEVEALKTHLMELSKSLEALLRTLETDPDTMTRTMESIKLDADPEGDPIGSRPRADISNLEAKIRDVVLTIQSI